MKLKHIIIVSIGLMAIPLMAQNERTVEVKPMDPSTAVAPDKETLSYAIGMNIGNNIKRQEADVNVDTIAKGMKDFLAGGATRMTEKEASDTLRNWSMSQRAKAEEKRKESAEKNKKAGEEFIAKKTKEAGVKVTPSGLAYKVITEGTGPTPKLSDTVTVNYRGTLTDGTEFDSSFKRNQPFETAVTGVIKGWTEALQLMKVGSKWELYIPGDLAYGQYGSPPKIGPNETLVFEVELLSIKAPAAESKTENKEVVSGEIIKVPSAEEMKKGAKIEVIKPGQTNVIEPKK